MNRVQLQVLGVVLLVVTAVLGFTAWERYEANAGNVRAMQTSPFGQMVAPLAGGYGLEPATPAITKYCIFLGLMALIGAMICFICAARSAPPGTPPAGGPPA